MLELKTSELDWTTIREKCARARVAIVSDAQLERNGVGAYYADLVDHLRTRLARIELIYPDTTDGKSRFALPLPGDSTQSIGLSGLPDLHARLTDFEPDLVIIPTPGPWGILGALIARMLHVPIVVGFHTHFEKLADLYWNDFVGNINRSYLRLSNKLLFHNAAVVLANCQAMVEEAQTMGAPKAFLMGTPIAERFVNEPVTPVRGEVKKVLFAGRLAREKNIETFVEAARQIPELEFEIAGDGPMRQELEHQAAYLPNLNMLGWLNRDRLFDVLETCDLLVLPSHVESLGTVALEALTRGRTVLVSPNCGITEWPDLDRALFRIHEDETTASAIRRVTTIDQAIRQKKADLGVEGAHEMNEKAVDGWLDIIANHMTYLSHPGALA